MHKMLRKRAVMSLECKCESLSTVVAKESSRGGVWVGFEEHAGFSQSGALHRGQWCTPRPPSVQRVQGE